MTRVEAIKFGTTWLGLHDDLKGTELYEFFKTSVKALQEEPCEDAISRQAVLNSIHANCVYENEYNLTAKHIEDAVKQLPPVTPQPKIGHWIYDNATYNWRCDKCGETPKTMGYVGSDKFMTEHFKFCNHCGAKMIEPQESERYCDRNICVSNEYNGIGCDECEVTKSRELQESEDK